MLAAVTRTRPGGMAGFTLVWVGQLASLLGSGMTAFAITIWAWQETGQATTLALVGLFSFAPTMLLSPIAGALVDRWNRKLVMMLSDLASGLATIAMLTLYQAGALEIWHLYLLGAWSGAFAAFQFPAYSAAITTMLAKRHYARASGMLSLAESASGIAAPVLAGLLLAAVGVAGVFVVDIVTFIVAVVTLFTVSNFIAVFGTVVVAPMVLARTAGDQLALASVHAAMGAGGVAGGLTLSLWGGPRRRIHGVLLGMAGYGLLGTLPLGLGPSQPWWMAAAFVGSFIVPLLNGSSQAIWQAKVPPDVQGRVFAARRFIAQGTAPLAMVAVGPVADRIMEPAMRPGAGLAEVFGPLVGVGPGAGMALMLVLAGAATGLVGLLGYLSPQVRDVEARLPDHVDATVSEAAR